MNHTGKIHMLGETIIQLSKLMHSCFSDILAQLYLLDTSELIPYPSVIQFVLWLRVVSHFP